MEENGYVKGLNDTRSTSIRTHVVVRAQCGPSSLREAHLQQLAEYPLCHVKFHEQRYTVLHFSGSYLFMTQQQLAAVHHVLHWTVIE